MIKSTAIQTNRQFLDQAVDRLVHGFCPTCTPSARLGQRVRALCGYVKVLRGVNYSDELGCPVCADAVQTGCPRCGQLFVG